MWNEQKLSEECLTAIIKLSKENEGRTFRWHEIGALVPPSPEYDLNVYAIHNALARTGKVAVDYHGLYVYIPQGAKMELSKGGLIRKPETSKSE